MFTKFKIPLLAALLLTVAVFTFAHEDPSAEKPSAEESPAKKSQVFIETENRSPLFTGGLSLGSSFSSPWVIVTLHGIYTPFTHVFVQLGLDIGVVSDNKDAVYYSIYPFLHGVYIRPLSKKIDWYAGGGGGFMFASYRFPGLHVNGSSSDAEHLYKVPALDLIAGISIIDVIDISYTFRTSFKEVNHKISFGYTFRGLK